MHAQCLEAVPGARVADPARGQGQAGHYGLAVQELMGLLLREKARSEHTGAHCPVTLYMYRF